MGTARPCGGSEEGELVGGRFVGEGVRSRVVAGTGQAGGFDLHREAEEVLVGDLSGAGVA